MTQPESTQGPATSAIAQRVKALRKAKGLSARELGELCEKAGAPQLNRSVIANLEAGRRPSVSVDELFVLAKVLDESPLSLLNMAQVAPLVNHFAELHFLAVDLLMRQTHKVAERPERALGTLTVEGAGEWVLSVRMVDSGSYREDGE